MILLAVSLIKSQKFHILEILEEAEQLCSEVHQNLINVASYKWVVSITSYNQEYAIKFIYQVFLYTFLDSNSHTV